MPDLDPPTTARPRRFRLSVRGLMLLIAFVGLALGLGQFWLANLNSDRATLTYQMRTLADREAPVADRLGAIDGLIQARGRQARRAMRLLAATLDDPSPEVRLGAVAIIGKLAPQLLRDAGPTAIETIRPAVVRLPELIDDPDDRVALQAIFAIGSLDGEARDRLLDREALVEKLSALLVIGGRAGGPPEGYATRHAVIDLLAWLDADSDTMPDWLQDALRDPDPDIREFAIATALDFVGRTRPDQKAPAWLLDAMADENPEVREAARWACSAPAARGGVWLGLKPRWTNPDEVAARLARQLDATDGDERLELIAQLAINDPDRAVGHLPEVIAHLEIGAAKRSLGRHSALLTLEHLGPDSLSAVPALCKAVESSMNDVHDYEFGRIVRLIVSLGAADSPEAQELLGVMLGSYISDPVAENLFRAIITFGPDASDKLTEASRAAQSDLGAQRRVNHLMDAIGIGAPPADPPDVE